MKKQCAICKRKEEALEVVGWFLVKKENFSGKEKKALMPFDRKVICYECYDLIV